ncbi:uncharacterized protein IL334_001194 [Kwoniella shivajii]|uniref:CSC1/OSCA1-like cytosolic domain-containing protein n=1 Tax=Kwoniella shivajii TaxID=564305 RepID=A0ABZ1CRE9_9TREE|nr:hypothetical protein IL334_001194 [Kwoniella shivajii]
MPEKCGLDLTVHARFLRGAFFYTLLQTFIIMPRQVRALALRVTEAREAKRTATRGEEGEDRWSVVDDCEGVKRFKTLMVTNIPPDILKDYFKHYLQRHRSRKRSFMQPPQHENRLKVSVNPPEGQEYVPQTAEGEVDEVILVRRLGTIASLRQRRQDVLRKLELVSGLGWGRMLMTGSRQPCEARPFGGSQT